MHSMRPETVREMVRQSHFGVLSLTHEGDAYGLPLFYTFDGGALYFHTLPGTKLRYLAATREACFTVVIVRTMDEWSSVQIFGQLERVDGTTKELAGMEALMTLPLPPEFGFTSFGEPKRANKSPIYKLNITRMSGRFSERHPETAFKDDIAVRGV